MPEPSPLCSWSGTAHSRCLCKHEWDQASLSEIFFSPSLFSPPPHSLQQLEEGCRVAQKQPSSLSSLGEACQKLTGGLPCATYPGKLWVCWLLCSVLCPEPLAKVRLAFHPVRWAFHQTRLESSMCGQGCQETNILSETVFKVKTISLSGESQGG